jgi:hypothetical protein
MNRATRPASSAHNRADPQCKLREGKRLRQGIVGPGIQQANAVFREVRGGHHKDGQIPFLRAYIAKNIQAALRGQIKIQNYKIVRLVRRKALGFPTV